MKQLTKFIVFAVLFTFFSTHLFSQMNSKREFRGVWVATVGNIDWPSVKAINNVELQKKEFINLLDQHKRSGMNAIILQVRPSADAFYAKSTEPWSRYITGKQGLAPSPYYDPLEFAIEETHKRGMELHAWFNPYRASTTLRPDHFSANHITRIHPEWFFTYDGKKLFNPGLPEVRKYIVDVIMGVVKNYDIDGVHFDDYFYPYPDSRNTPIPDQITFGKYNNGFSKIDDWRRNNVNMLIQELSEAIKKEKPYVKFGISPFGIWDNKGENKEGSETRGLSGYRTLFADGVKWLQEGWVDYINPQIYFPFGNRAAAFEILCSWWQNHCYGRHLYIGHGAYRVTENKTGWTDKSQIPRQIRYIRNQKNIEGSIFFSSSSLMDNLAGLRDSIRTNLYHFSSLPPCMPWIDSIPPNAPTNLQVRSTTNPRLKIISWQKPGIARDQQPVYGYVVYRFNVGEEPDLEDATKIIHISYDQNETTFSDDNIPPDQQFNYVVTAIDRMKNESSPCEEIKNKLAKKKLSQIY